jgi:hypothetical protein
MDRGHGRTKKPRRSPASINEQNDTSAATFQPRADATPSRDFSVRTGGECSEYLHSRRSWPRCRKGHTRHSKPCRTP